jgi:hypothetical protein
MATVVSLTLPSFITSFDNNSLAGFVNLETLDLTHLTTHPPSADFSGNNSPFVYSDGSTHFTGTLTVTVKVPVDTSGYYSDWSNSANWPTGLTINVVEIP